MKRLCFGTLFKILYQARKSKQITNERLLFAVFSAYKLNEEPSSNTIGHLKDGKDNVPTYLRDAVKTISQEEAYFGFQNNVVPLLKNDKQEFIVKAILKVLEEDLEISNIEIVGRSSGYEKENIINSTDFDFVELLEAVFYYTILYVDQRSSKDLIKEINKEFFDTIERLDRKVYLDNFSNTAKLLLPKTINSKGYNSTFKEIYSLKLCSDVRPSTIHIYTVEISNDRFKFTIMKELIFNNISNYVMSREKMKRADQTGSQYRLGQDALKKYQKSCGQSEETILGETLLYVFLEQVLDAPKIMSKIELDSHNGNARSEGVYLYRSSHNGIEFTQMVFGVSQIVNSLSNAIESAFEKIISIRMNDEDEFYLVDSMLTANIVDYETQAYLKELIFPKKVQTTSITEASFGCFLGYSLPLKKYKRGIESFSDFAVKQMRDDIDGIKGFIEDLIVNNHLEGYNFYFYVLPFNNADEEKISIANDISWG